MADINVASESAELLDQLLDEYNYSVIFPLYDAIGDCECGCVKALLVDMLQHVLSLKSRMTETQAKLEALHHACKIKPE